MHGDVNAAVIDVGSVSTKGGCAGDDIPKAVFPTSVGLIAGPPPLSLDSGTSTSTEKQKTWLVGSNALALRRDTMEIVEPLRHGLVHEWEAIEQVWEHVLKDRLMLVPSEHPILLSEPSYTTKLHRERTTQLIFEHFKTPAFFLAKTAVLSSFSAGKPTSLIVDCGGSSTVVTPVYEGYVLNRGVVTSGIGGQWLTNTLTSALQQRGISVTPQFLFTKSEVGPGEFRVSLREVPHTQSYKNFMIKGIVDDMKESLCQVASSPIKDLKAVIPVGGTAPRYELPDGQCVELPLEQTAIPELLFNPTLFKELAPPPNSTPLPEMVKASLTRCDTDARALMQQNVLITGGSSIFPGLVDRLNSEVSSILPASKGNRFIAPGPLERKFSVFIGGSILASLESFVPMWISSQEYLEKGASVVNSKCP
ncbi:Glycoside hydrolase, family 1 [Pelomyxa schiedti]|nr:Glycoside hydrolase, family 1 [Pelomyxa schiedti]KAH3744055.1 Glycoside hydrolase, family 1 [Pelomyxa schiedti]